MRELTQVQKDKLRLDLLNLREKELEKDRAIKAYDDHLSKISRDFQSYVLPDDVIITGPEGPIYVIIERSDIRSNIGVEFIQPNESL